MKTNNKLSKVLKLELRHLLSVYPPNEMRNYLRTMYADFLDKKEAAGQISSANAHIQHMQALFNFLSIAGEETIGWERGSV
jgi:hypothetical protein